MKKVRMSKKLKAWVDQAVSTRAISDKRRKLIVDILQEFEAAGDAMRQRTGSGTIIWKATPEVLRRIAADERAIIRDLKNELG